jgi:hypothetical protein
MLSEPQAGRQVTHMGTEADAWSQVGFSTREVTCHRVVVSNPSFPPYYAGCQNSERHAPECPKKIAKHKPLRVDCL